KDLPLFRDARIRRALNLAVNRNELIANGLNGHGVASSGLIWPSYWAFQSSHSALSFDPRGASETLRPREIRFVCLVPREFERVALVLKQQLEAVGVQLDLREISLENLDEALLTGNFDAALTDFVSGPSVFR